MCKGYTTKPYCVHTSGAWNPTGRKLGAKAAALLCTPRYHGRSLKLPRAKQNQEAIRNAAQNWSLTFLNWLSRQKDPWLFEGAYGSRAWNMHGCGLSPLSLMRQREYDLKKWPFEPCEVCQGLYLKRLCVRGNAKLKTCKKYSVQLEIWHTFVTIYKKKKSISNRIQWSLENPK